jgi:hypothetical protein
VEHTVIHMGADSNIAYASVAAFAERRGGHEGLSSESGKDDSVQT